MHVVPVVSSTMSWHDVLASASLCLSTLHIALQRACSVSRCVVVLCTTGSFVTPELVSLLDEELARTPGVLDADW